MSTISRTQLQLAVRLCAKILIGVALVGTLLFGVVLVSINGREQPGETVTEFSVFEVIWGSLMGGLVLGLIAAALVVPAVVLWMSFDRLREPERRR